MTEQSPTPSNNQNGSRKGLAFFEVGIVEILSIVFILILFFGILNYFNILSISQMFPQLNWLPHRETPKQNTTVNYQNLKSSAPSELSYTCPVSNGLCKNGDLFSITHSIPIFYGLGYESLASGTPILAILPGEYSYGSSVGQEGKKSTVLTIINKDLDVEVDYNFKGNPYIPSRAGKVIVKQGDAIGWLSSESLEKIIVEGRVILGKSYSLIASVQRLKTKDYIKVKPSLDGKKLDIVK